MNNRTRPQCGHTDDEHDFDGTRPTRAALLGFVTWLCTNSESASPVIRAEARRLLDGEEEAEAWKGRVVKEKERPV